MTGTRARLLDAAGRCFADKGVHRTSIADVAREAGLTRPTVYRYFPGRDDLVRGYLLRLAPRFTSKVAAHLAGVDGPEETLVEAVLFCLEELPRDPAFRILFAPEAASFTSRIVLGSPELLDAAGRLLAPLPLRPEVSPADVAEWTIRVIFSLTTVPGARRRRRDDYRALLRALLVPAVLRT